VDTLSSLLESFPQKSNFLPIFPGAVGDQGLIEHWDGTAWSIVPNPKAPSPGGRCLAGVSCLSATSCWASGTTTNSGGTSGPSLMERWNGSVWVVVPSATPVGVTGTILSSVTCLDAAECWTVGSILAGSPNNFQPQAVVETWNGASWVIQSSPNVTALSLLGGVACVHGTGCWAAGSTVTNVSGDNPLFQTLIEQLAFPPQSVQGLWMTSSDGVVYAFGQARQYAPVGPHPIRQPVVAMAVTADRRGYWLVDANGGVFSFGDATFHGRANSQPPGKLIVGMTPTPTGLGYWLVSAGGQVFNFGDASPRGSLSSSATGGPVVAIAETPDGEGYWLVTAEGNVFPFGDAKTYPPTGASPEDHPTAGMAVTPDDRGYWLVTVNGDVRAFGDATYYGSLPGQGISSPVPIASLVPTPDGHGYWIVSSNGSVYEYGDAIFLGSLGAKRPPDPIGGAAGF